MASVRHLERVEQHLSVQSADKDQKGAAAKSDAYSIVRRWHKTEVEMAMTSASTAAIVRYATEAGETLVIPIWPPPRLQ